MTSSDASREVPVSTALLREAEQYRTVQTVQQWPLVTNSTTAVLDGYQSLKVRPPRFLPGGGGVKGDTIQVIRATKQYLQLRLHVTRCKQYAARYT